MPENGFDDYEYVDDDTSAAGRRLIGAYASCMLATRYMIMDKEVVTLMDAVGKATGMDSRAVADSFSLMGIAAEMQLGEMSQDGVGDPHVIMAGRQMLECLISLYPPQTPVAIDDTLVTEFLDQTVEGLDVDGRNYFLKGLTQLTAVTGETSGQVSIAA